MEHAGTDDGPRDDGPREDSPREERHRQERHRGHREGSIGDMNGKWGFLFRAVLITTPAFWAIFVTVDLPWRVWVTRSVYHLQEENNALLKIDSKIDELVRVHDKDYREMSTRMDNLPPPEWRARVEKLEDWERENKSDHLKILVTLEAIRTRLDIPEPSTK